MAHFKDKGVQILAKLFKVQGAEKLNDEDFIRELIKTVLENLGYTFSDLKLLGIHFIHDDDNHSYVCFSSESISIALEIFRNESSVFVNIFPKKNTSPRDLKAQVVHVKQNLSAVGINYNIIYRQ